MPSGAANTYGRHAQNETPAWNLPISVLRFWGKITMPYAGTMAHRWCFPSTTSSYLQYWARNSEEQATYSFLAWVCAAPVDTPGPARVIRRTGTTTLWLPGKQTYTGNDEGLLCVTLLYHGITRTETRNRAFFGCKPSSFVVAEKLGEMARCRRVQWFIYPRNLVLNNGRFRASVLVLVWRYTPGRAQSRCRG